MFVPTPNKMYCCVLTNVVLVYITIIWPICPLQNITNLRLENSRQKFSPTKNSLQNLTYFQNVISNPATVELPRHFFAANYGKLLRQTMKNRNLSRHLRRQLPSAVANFEGWASKKPPKPCKNILKNNLFPTYRP